MIYFAICDMYVLHACTGFVCDTHIHRYTHMTIVVVGCTVYIIMYFAMVDRL